jgi:hypothetical protein
MLREMQLQILRIAQRDRYKDDTGWVGWSEDTTLVVAEGDHGVDVGGAAGGEQAREG